MSEEELATKRAQDRRAKNTHDYQQTFMTEPGQRVLRDLMQQHGMLRSSFSRDALEMARMEGERNVVLRILQALSVDPEVLQQLIREVTSD